MEEILNYIAAAVIVTPGLVLLAIPVFLVLAATVIALSDWLIGCLDMRDRFAKWWKRDGQARAPNLPPDGFARMSAIARNLNR